MLKPWLLIGVITFVVALGANVLRPRDIKWFRRLQRPRWLTFEKLIPMIWTIVFICGAWSAYIVWKQNPGAPQTWTLMGAYLLLELITVAYSPVTLWTHSLKAGTAIGGAGALWGLIVAIWVSQISIWATVLLIPYLLWSPAGTYITWKMDRLN
ncbi:tryptophan-rich sensory protein [Romeria aff. gracilis LEGE 07310]|uniref:Tryptophan-rich sensory protein n=1 Tax=Vasconcelosia minhoensis LEGE 07310 TaxID=915328 RepID=A0A8J7DCL8_9CYAN|nr:tryptophan-rich sensory protein [Romeria gracilis]MBE9079027.1 tryptophan-rich sensory protein [Romeria aff. gracilis LEGE 07310]